ncbi:MAG: nuclear transport factor 2 family protein [Flavobacteriaceae bacterium]
MRTKIFFISISLLFSIWQTKAQSNNEQKSLKGNTENHPVRTLYLSSIEAFNDGDLELFLANFSADVKMYGTDGLYEGKAALRERFKAILQQFPKKKMDIPELKLHILSKEVVMVNFRWKLYPMGQGPSYEGVGSGIYTLQQDKWVEILEVETVTAVDEVLQQKQ